jgi:predicted RNA-binding Zn-ribbon protein involved in translation (DUF1610 family)
MPSVIFRCPNTGRTVQGWLEEDVSVSDVYVSVECPVCTRTHLVNPKTARVLGATDKRDK